MTVNDFNTIQTMFENEMKENLIKSMRTFISSEIRIANESIKVEKRAVKKVEKMETHAGRVSAVLDFMYDSDILDIETYRSEYDRLIVWKLKKVSEIYRG